MARVTVAELEHLHLCHLEGGAPRIAAAVRALAGVHGVSVAEEVGMIAGATASGSPALAGWATVVAPFVQAAIEAGALAMDQPDSGSAPSESIRQAKRQSMPSSGPGS